MKSPFRLHWKLDGKLVVPVDDFMEWARWYETADRLVKQTRVGPLDVSTVFIGLDHNFLQHSDRPLVFETMVFGAHQKNEMDESFCERYSTWEEAEAGHAVAVAWAEAVVNKAKAKLCLSPQRLSTVTSSGTLKN